MSVTGIVSINAVSLDDDLHLLGLETNPPISYSIKQTLGGNQVVQTHARTMGASLRLVARHDGSSSMGQFCSSHLDSLRTIAAAGTAVAIIHPAIDVADNVTVFVLEFNVEQSDEREPPGANKKWHGEIILQET
jgi:hypothetical protein